MNNNRNNTMSMKIQQRLQVGFLGMICWSSMMNATGSYGWFGLASSNTPKKKIIVFSSRGGGGHTSVSNALKTYLEPDYDVKVVNLIDTVLKSMDPVRKATLNKYAVEDIYNIFLRGIIFRLQLLRMILIRRITYED